MTRDWTQQQTVRLISSLKTHEVLWKSRSKTYKVRKEKEIAWSVIEKDVGHPVNECKRRVESLMAGCRREKNRILKSKAVDAPEFLYKPKWIYWNSLSFLTGGTEIENSNSSALMNGEQWAPSSRRPLRKRRKTQKQETITSLQDEVKVSDEINSEGHKYQWDGDEYDAYGITVAAKLRKMDPCQRLFAENIINQTLFKGMLFQLNVDSDCNPRMWKID